MKEVVIIYSSFLWLREVTAAATLPRCVLEGSEVSLAICEEFLEAWSAVSKSGDTAQVEVVKYSRLKRGSKYD